MNKEREAVLLHDLWIVLDELKAHEENTGEFLEDEDAALIQQIRTAHPRPSPAEHAAAISKLVGGRT